MTGWLAHTWIGHLLAGALKNNPFFNGGFVLMVLGALAAGARPLFGWLWEVIQHQCFVVVEVTNYDNAYEALQEWLARVPRSRRFRSLSISTTFRETHGHTTGPNSEITGTSSGIRFAPAPGVHFLVFDRRLIWVNRIRDTAAQTHGVQCKERLSLRIFCRSPEIARRIISKAVALGQAVEERLITVWQMDQWGHAWSLAGRRLPRSLESVLLPEAKLDALVADCERYLNSRSWYEQLGIPYRRGYLLHGVPGTGKTSTVAAIASHFESDIYVLSLTAHNLTDQHLASLIAKVPPGGVLLLEDVDAIFAGRTETHEKVPVSFSGLLNALDGIHTSEGRLLFMTTNHPEKLDPALVRPGRIDYRLEFGYATFEQAERLFQRFFPDSPETSARQFARRVPAGTCTMAQLLQYLLTHAGAPEAALTTVLPGLTLPVLKEIC